MGYYNQGSRLASAVDYINKNPGADPLEVAARYGVTPDELGYKQREIESAEKRAMQGPQQERSAADLRENPQTSIQQAEKYITEKGTIVSANPSQPPAKAINIERATPAEATQVQLLAQQGYQIDGVPGNLTATKGDVKVTISGNQSAVTPVSAQVDTSQFQQMERQRQEQEQRNAQVRPMIDGSQVRDVLKPGSTVGVEYAAQNQIVQEKKSNIPTTVSYLASIPGRFQETVSREVIGVAKKGGVDIPGFFAKKEEEFGAAASSPNPIIATYGAAGRGVNIFLQDVTKKPLVYAATGGTIGVVSKVYPSVGTAALAGFTFISGVKAGQQPTIPGKVGSILGDATILGVSALAVKSPDLIRSTGSYIRASQTNANLRGQLLSPADIVNLESQKIAVIGRPVENYAGVSVKSTSQLGTITEQGLRFTRGAPQIVRSSDTSEFVALAGRSEKVSLLGGRSSAPVGSRLPSTNREVGRLSGGQVFGQGEYKVVIPTKRLQSIISENIIESKPFIGGRSTLQVDAARDNIFVRRSILDRGLRSDIPVSERIITKGKIIPIEIRPTEGTQGGRTRSYPEELEYNPLRLKGDTRQLEAKGEFVEQYAGGVGLFARRIFMFERATPMSPVFGKGSVVREDYFIIPEASTPITGSFLGGRLKVFNRRDLSTPSVDSSEAGLEVAGSGGTVQILKVEVEKPTVSKQKVRQFSRQRTESRSQYDVGQRSQSQSVFRGQKQSSKDRQGVIISENARTVQVSESIPALRQSGLSGVTFSLSGQTSLQRAGQKISQSPISIQDQAQGSSQVTRQAVTSALGSLQRQRLGQSQSQSQSQSQLRSQQLLRSQTRQVTEGGMKLRSLNTKVPIPKPYLDQKGRPKTNNRPSATGGLGYGVEIKVRGKYQRLPGVYTKAGALDIGAGQTARRLAATFRVVEAKGAVSQARTGEYAKYAKLFRTYKIQAGKRVALKDTFIQKKGARLATQSERLAIQRARSGTDIGVFA